MELLEKVVIHNKGVLTFCLCILCGFSVFSQNSEHRVHPANIELFPKPGFEPLPPHKSKIIDRSNFKPENFRFSDATGKSLNDRLSAGVGIEPASCKPSYGLFKFRVNGKGVIDSTWFDGQLSKEVSVRILDNIRATEGSWVITSGTKEADVAWYVYFYSDTRARWDKKMKCTESDKELQKAVSAISNYYYNLYYWIGEDKATLIRPTANDGQPRY
ncbi:hypothetical protein [Salmonirosea aquatica]|uniref:Uncharacterized protein n=1 Tax=Salmonirosea aquatica TaxID=2654236 RepID=A0A7C9BFT3_9BACT|nr:hypothetical protein [Cytophagaceae bacterium SJW1-29]